MNLEAYFQRINYDGSRVPDAATLRALHHAHLLAVPSENLEIPLGRRIVHMPDALFEKIVMRRRAPPHHNRRRTRNQTYRRCQRVQHPALGNLWRGFMNLQNA